MDSSKIYVGRVRWAWNGLRWNFIPKTMAIWSFCVQLLLHITIPSSNCKIPSPFFKHWAVFPPSSLLPRTYISSYSNENFFSIMAETKMYDFGLHYSLRPIQCPHFNLLFLCPLRPSLALFCITCLQRVFLISIFKVTFAENNSLSNMTLNKSITMLILCQYSRSNMWKWIF